MNTVQAIALQSLRNIARHAFVCAALGVVVLFGVLSQDKVSVDRPAPEGSAEGLVAAHDCGSHITDPTHVVVTVDGVTRYAGQRMTDKAVEQAVFGMDLGLTVHAFCA